MSSHLSGGDCEQCMTSYDVIQTRIVVGVGSVLGFTYTGQIVDGHMTTTAQQVVGIMELYCDQDW